MHSLRTKITMLTVWMIVIAVSVVTFVSVVFIRRNEHHNTEQVLLLLCETGERNLDYYFNSVHKSVNRVSNFVERDLSGLDDESLAAHIERVAAYFENMAYRTNGVLTYYYRIDPEVSDTVKGFWYTDLDGDGFVEHEVTDITLYDTEDTSQLVWFTVPKHTGRPIWLPPYITDNLDRRVISYNEPIYWRGDFVGVVGIEIDYVEMAKQVESIRLYNNGYAFLSDAEGNLFFHPRIDVTQLTPETMPATPEGVISDSTFLYYTFEGVPRQAAWLSLDNGMRFNVTVPVSETEGNWRGLIGMILFDSVIVLIALSLFTLYYTRRITRPLQKLTEAAEQLHRGNYDFDLDYDADDEVGRLTATFKDLSRYMDAHIRDLNKRAFVDALTSVKNKGAFTSAVDMLQAQINRDEPPAFAVGVFDCDDLKQINDRFGHDKGDLYLKTACRVICHVFKHSPVYRIGGDEFAVILQNDDYAGRVELESLFNRTIRETCDAAAHEWEKPGVSMGIAEYNPKLDRSAVDTVRRADRLMYVNKRSRKTTRRPALR